MVILVKFRATNNLTSTISCIWTSFFENDVGILYLIYIVLELIEMDKPQKKVDFLRQISWKDKDSYVRHHLELLECEYKEECAQLR